MKILIGCEESQIVCKAFRARGHEAYSNDIIYCSGGKPEWHLKMDVFEAIALGGWDMGIFFPPCTYLTNSANKYLKDQPPLKSGCLVGAERRRARRDAIDFVENIYNCGIPKICIENPVGVLSTAFRKPDQVVHPYMFGSSASKATCFWLKGLPLLVPTQYIEPTYHKNGLPRWDNQSPSGAPNLGPSPDRAKLRSKTYAGIAEAMASQWG